MGCDAEATEPADVFHHGRRFPAKWEWRRSHVERDVVATVGADLDAIQTEDVVDVLGRVRWPCAVAMIGEDHEPESGLRSRAGDFLASASTVGCRGVDVKAPAIVR